MIVTVDAIETITKTAEIVVEVADRFSDQQLSDLLERVEVGETHHECHQEEWKINAQDIQYSTPSVSGWAASCEEPHFAITVREDERVLVRQCSRSLREQETPQLVELLLRHECWDAIIDYAKNVLKGRWPEAEDKICKSKNPAEVFRYANAVIGGRWPRAEAIIVGSDWEECYAKNVLPGNWDEDVAKKCTCWLYYYAKDVIGGKLPAHLHNRMITYGMQKSKDPWVKRYLGSKKYQHPPRKPR